MWFAVSKVQIWANLSGSFLAGCFEILERILGFTASLVGVYPKESLKFSREFQRAHRGDV